MKLSERIAAATSFTDELREECALMLVTPRGRSIIQLILEEIDGNQNQD